MAYAPTEMTSPDKKDQFYDDLQAAIISEPSHTLVAVLGDFNAWIGVDSHKQHSQVVGRYLYHDETSDNGNRLVDLCLATQLRVAQSRFPQPRKRLWTWRHPAGSSLAQLDHILISAKWIRSVTNCRAYNSLEIDSDHRVLSAHLRIRFRATQPKKCKRPQFNWEKLSTDENTQQQFAICLSNKFQALQAPESDVQQHYDTILENVTQAQETLG